jgi:hypothetical protein
MPGMASNSKNGEAVLQAQRAFPLSSRGAEFSLSFAQVAPGRSMLRPYDCKPRFDPAKIPL